MLASAINWTTVLTALIAGLPAIIAAFYSRSVHQQVKTPSGKPLGEAVEYTHDTAIANNLLLRAANGGTRPINGDEVHDYGAVPPEVPDGSAAPRAPEPPLPE